MRNIQDISPLLYIFDNIISIRIGYGTLVSIFDNNISPGQGQSIIICNSA